MHVSMFENARWRAFEFLRCAKHNAVDLRIFRIEYRGGIYRVRTPEKTLLRFPYYPFLPFYEIEGYLRRGAWRLEPGMVVLDVGACHGEFALYASTVVGPSGRVLMIEPDPANLAQAQEVFALNGGKPANLTIVTEGLWLEPGKVEFATGLGSASGVVAAQQADLATPVQPRAVTINTESLASLITKHQLSRLDFIKLDIEGAELEVVDGGADVLRRYGPKLAVASYHLRDGVRTAIHLKSRLRQIGYTTETAFPNHLTTCAWPSAASAQQAPWSEA